MDKFIKEENINPQDNNNNNTNNDNDDIDKIKSPFDDLIFNKLLAGMKNKKAALIGAGGIVALLILGVFMHHSTSVNVNTGLSTQELQNTMSQVVTPIFKQEQQLSQQQQEQNKAILQMQKQLQQQQQQKEQQLKQEEQKIQQQMQSLAQKPPLKLKNYLPKNSSKSLPSLPEANLPALTGMHSVPLKPSKPFQEVDVEQSTPKSQFGQSESLFNSPYGQSVKKNTKHNVYIPAGSIVEGRLMYGFVAPTSGVLPPVLIQITKPIYTANGWYIPAQKCLITTEAQYDISMGLALLGGNGSTMSCVLNNGHVIQIPVNVSVGQETTKHGISHTIMGLTGQERYLSSKDYATIMALATANGLASAGQQGQVSTFYGSSGNPIQSIKHEAPYAIYGGVAQGLNTFEQFWLQKFNGMVPSIIVPPKNHIFIVFVSGASLGVSPHELEGLGD